MKYTMTRASYIPKGAIKIVPKGYDLEIYLYDDKKGPCAMIFGGKRNKPDVHTRYKSIESREADIKRHLEVIDRTNAGKAERKSLRVLKTNPLKVGDVLTGSWGWEQTNPEAWQVVEVKAASVKVRPIGFQHARGNGEQSMSEYVVPVKDQFTGEGEWKRVQTYDGGKSVYLTFEHYSASLWTGREMYNSWYA